MPRISLGLGISSSSKLPPTPTIPGGINVATANAVNISGQNLNVPDGTYTKVTSNLIRVAGSDVSDKMFVNTGLVYLKEAGYTGNSSSGNPPIAFVPFGHILVPPNTTFTASFFEPLAPEPYWRAGVVYGAQGEEGASFIFGFANSNPSTDPTIIPTSGWALPISINVAPAAPAAPVIDTNYVQDIFLTNSNSVGMNGVWQNVSSNFGFPAWINYLFSSYVYLFAPNNGYSGGESWYFYDSDQGDSAGISNPSTNPGSLPTTGWTQNISISAHTWKIADNNYLVRGLTYDDGNSYYSYPANGVSVKRTPQYISTLYGDNRTFITYSAANGGTFTLLQQIPYEESSFISAMATKTGSPSARGIPVYGYTIGNPAQQYVTGSLIIEPILYIPLSAASINVSGLTFAEQYASEYFYNQPFVKDEDGDPAWGTYNSDDNGYVNYYSFDKRWEMGVYYGNTAHAFAYNYASSVSGIPLSGWLMTQEFINVTGYPRITRV
jgi:hypothetical protein